MVEMDRLDLLIHAWFAPLDPAASSAVDAVSTLTAGDIFVELMRNRPDYDAPSRLVDEMAELRKIPFGDERTALLDRMRRFYAPVVERIRERRRLEEEVESAVVAWRRGRKS